MGKKKFDVGAALDAVASFYAGYLQGEELERKRKKEELMMDLMQKRFELETRADARAERTLANSEKHTQFVEDHTLRAEDRAERQMAMSEQHFQQSQKVAWYNARLHAASVGQGAQRLQLERQKLEAMQVGDRMLAEQLQKVLTADKDVMGNPVFKSKEERNLALQETAAGIAVTVPGYDLERATRIAENTASSVIKPRNLVHSLGTKPDGTSIMNFMDGLTGELVSTTELGPDPEKRANAIGAMVKKVDETVKSIRDESVDAFRTKPMVFSFEQTLDPDKMAQNWAQHLESSAHQIFQREGVESLRELVEKRVPLESLPFMDRATYDSLLDKYVPNYFSITDQDKKEQTAKAIERELQNTYQEYNGDNRAFFEYYDRIREEAASRGLGKLFDDVGTEVINNLGISRPRPVPTEAGTATPWDELVF